MCVRTKSHYARELRGRVLIANDLLMQLICTDISHSEQRDLAPTGEAVSMHGLRSYKFRAVAHCQIPTDTMNSSV